MPYKAKRTRTKSRKLKEADGDSTLPHELFASDRSCVLFKWIDRLDKPKVCDIVEESKLRENCYDAETKKKSAIDFFYIGQVLTVKNLNKFWEIEIIDRGCKEEMENAAQTWVEEQVALEGSDTDEPDDFSHKNPVQSHSAKLLEEIQAEEARGAESSDSGESSTDDDDSEYCDDKNDYSEILQQIKDDVAMVAMDLTTTRSEVRAITASISSIESKLELLLKSNLNSEPEESKQGPDTTPRSSKSTGGEKSPEPSESTDFEEIDFESLSSKEKIANYKECAKAARAGEPHKLAQAMIDKLYTQTERLSGKCLPGSKNTDRQELSPNRVNFILSRVRRRFGALKMARSEVKVLSKMNSKFYDTKFKAGKKDKKVTTIEPEVQKKAQKRKSPSQTSKQVNETPDSDGDGLGLE